QNNETNDGVDLSEKSIKKRLRI
ncbi:MAG: hypothetical protein RL335_1220, partial [Bacteroidota bacterium]